MKFISVSASEFLSYLTPSLIEHLVLQKDPASCERQVQTHPAQPPLALAKHLLRKEIAPFEAAPKYHQCIVVAPANSLEQDLLQGQQNPFLQQEPSERRDSASKEQFVAGKRKSRHTERRPREGIEGAKPGQRGTRGSTCQRGGCGSVASIIADID
ncbi:hypothetical protein FGO68_gene9413 [Halteria grandinella]|uniref:Uncharacterized protein n=1 Tax=Halteria grandinella TaxID=5974 RepID=A0A8J8NFC2_HALGN|nr:hypothetical protein FGO68_gene9413 [Halteria grandinella]